MMELYKIGYTDAYNIPVGRRRRLLGWKNELMQQQQAAQKAEMNRPRGRR